MQTVQNCDDQLNETKYRTECRGKCKNFKCFVFPFEFWLDGESIPNTERIFLSLFLPFNFTCYCLMLLVVLLLLLRTHTHRIAKQAKVKQGKVNLKRNEEDSSHAKLKLFSHNFETLTNVHENATTLNLFHSLSLSFYIVFFVLFFFAQLVLPNWCANLTKFRRIYLHDKNL